MRIILLVHKAEKKNNKKSLTIPISKVYKFSGEEKSEPVKLIEKYININNDLRDRPKKDRLFFNVSQGYINKKLKDISVELKFELGKKITFHTSRHTFAKIGHTHFGISISMISEMMQHNNISTTMIYENSSEKEREKIMDGIDWDKIK